jgi:hypothetical protein
MMTYAYRIGQRVQHRDGRTGEITSMVPGNGTFPWYFVHWDNGTEDRHTGDELTATWTPGHVDYGPDGGDSDSGL